VGRLLDLLRERGLYDSSLIVFTSDHGEALGEHKTVGHVRTLYDELLHVPLVIKPPHAHPARARLAAASAELVRHIDVVPTVLELLLLPALPGQRGASLLERHGPRLHAAETHRPEAPRDLFCVRNKRHKLIFVPESERFELYDLVSDPGELEDVFERDGGRLTEWQALLRGMAARSAGSGLDRDDLDPAMRARLESLGYL
jgi:arylsulfatase A-like enzyme